MGLRLMVYTIRRTAQEASYESSRCQHYHAIYSDFLNCKKMKIFSRNFFHIFLIFAQNIDCGYTSTRNLCFGATIRKIGIPLQTPFYYIKMGYDGVYISRICFPDEMFWIDSVVFVILGA